MRLAGACVGVLAEDHHLRLCVSRHAQGREDLVGRRENGETRTFLLDEPLEIDPVAPRELRSEQDKPVRVDQRELG
jgi:hypothetical protein